MPQAPGFQFVNFTAATRKSLLIPSNYFSPNDNISWIYSIPSAGVFDGAFTSSSSWVVTHNLNTATPLVQCYDNTGQLIEPATIVATNVNVVTITWDTPQAGKVVVSGG